MFTLNTSDMEKYDILFKCFRYDSSLNPLILGRNDDFENFKYKNRIVPVNQGRVGGFNFKLGGTYLKLTPKQLLDGFMLESKRLGLVSVAYVHPYEIIPGDRFKVPFHKLREHLDLRRALFRFIRQKQWARLNSKHALRNIKHLIACSKKGAINDNTRYY